ncbi:MAG: HEPN domain-containing protein [Nanoarchaeota archaeon]
MRIESKEWLFQAKQDYNTAEYLIQGNKLQACAFYSQQRAEKALKAVQIELLKRFDRTHDLVLLSSSVNAPQHIIEACSQLSPQYVATRYPDTKKVHTLPDVNKLLQHSREVLEWASKTLNSKKN